jgi:hypothetical protein
MIRRCYLLSCQLAYIRYLLEHHMNIRRAIACVFTVGLSLSFVSCLHSSDDESFGDYFPFMPENAWYYSGSGGNSASDTTVIGAAYIENGEMYRALGLPGGGLFDLFQLFRESDDGIRVYVQNIAPAVVDSIVKLLPLDDFPLQGLTISQAEPEWMFLKKPLRNGTSWSTTSISVSFKTPISGFPVNGTATFSISVTAASESITVPAGTFEAIRTDWSASGVAMVQSLRLESGDVPIGSIWYAPEVGPVKFLNATTNEISELNGWHVPILDTDF